MRRDDIERVSDIYFVCLLPPVETSAPHSIHDPNRLLHHRAQQHNSNEHSIQMNPSDPSEWSSSRLPQLTQLDSLQRCLICKDFLKAPVITSCNHTFCSQCIRQHLMSTTLCPLCKTEQFESNLKRVILLEEIVLCYQSLRSDLLQLLRAQEEEKQQPSQRHQSPEAEIIEIPDDGSPVKSLGPVPNDNKRPTVPARQEYVSCPVCSQSMTAEFLQASHLDDCLSGKKTKVPKPAPAKRKTEIASFFQPKKRQQIDHSSFYFSQPEKHHHEVKKIPKMDFASLTTPKLKNKLSALKLATTGSRTQLELRYNHYYLLHNSNLDSSHPVSDLVLRQRLMQWEKSHQAFSSPHGGNGVFGDSLSHKSLTDKDFPVGAWLDKYHDEFRRLVKQARASAKKRKHEAKTDMSANGVADANSDDSTHQHQHPVPHTGAKAEKPDGSSGLTSEKDGEDDYDNSGENVFDFSNSTLFPTQDAD